MTSERRFSALPERDQRWYEDYPPGAIYAIGSFWATQTDMVAFAQRFDPQPMHVDNSRTGGIIASGWHTACLAMRLIAENYLSSVGGLPSPGVEAISWRAPLRPDDVVDVTAEVLSARVSATKPDRGILRTRFEAINEKGDLVMSFEAVNFVLRRP